MARETNPLISCFLFSVHQMAIIITTTTTVQKRLSDVSSKIPARSFLLICHGGQGHLFSLSFDSFIRRTFAICDQPAIPDADSVTKRVAAPPTKQWHHNFLFSSPTSTEVATQKDIHWNGPRRIEGDCSNSNLFTIRLQLAADFPLKPPVKVNCKPRYY